MFLELPNVNRQQDTCLYKTLLDSGASISVVNSREVQHLGREPAKLTSFTTVAEKFNCTKTCRTQIKIPELKISSKIDVKIHVTQMNGHYDVILGRDVLSKFGIILNFEQQLVQWGNKTVEMRLKEFTQETSYFVNNIQI